MSVSGIDAMGIENATQGICGFTSTLYAVYSNRPELKGYLDKALAPADRSTRLMAEIKSFLVMMQAEGKHKVLSDIEALTRSFEGYGAWTLKDYIADINKMGVPGSKPLAAFSIAMPPESTMEYMRTAWGMRPSLVDKLVSGDAIVGLTRTGGPRNAWKNLAHYVYQGANGTIYSWGEQFKSLEAVNKAKGRDYSVIYTIKV
jgi:hypothetical protein